MTAFGTVVAGNLVRTKSHVLENIVYAYSVNSCVPLTVGPGDCTEADG